VGEEASTGVERAREAAEEEKQSLKQRFAALQQRRPWIRHVVEAWQLLSANNGNQYAAAITYWTFLALFPLLLLAVSILGFVLHAHPATLQDVLKHITDSTPGTLGKTLSDSLKAAVNARAGVGIVGIVGVLLTGLGWIGNLRQAIDAVWGIPPVKRSFIAARASSLLVLAGLGLSLLISLGITAVGTSATDQLVRAVNLDHVPGMPIVVKVVGLAIAVAGDFLIFYWMMVRLPAISVPRGPDIKGALLAAVGFEILKIVGTYTIAHAAQSPTAGPFASVLAVLIWIQLVARYLLFCTAWIAVLSREQEPMLLTDPDELPGAVGTHIERQQLGMSWRQATRVAGTAAVVGALFGARATEVKHAERDRQR
jgi:membrane protein